jgi:hypothetical protein
LFLRDEFRHRCRHLRENREPRHGTFAIAAIYFGERKSSGMAHSMSKEAKRGTRSPVVIAMVVAVLGMLAMLIVDHGPWSRPHIKTAEMANYTTTGAAAQAAGATVTPTEPKPQLEPIAPGPKPVHPANAAAGSR